MSTSYDLVVPTIGRPSLSVLLSALATGRGPRPAGIWVVDDRRARSGPLPTPPAELEPLVRVVEGAGSGPAAARNVGWRAGSAPWVVFLDDDVVPDEDWAERLAEDLGRCEPDVGGSQGRLVVPLPDDRRPTDWERNVAGLERAVWATADIAYRRAVLEEVGGFDERFPRAYREDADLGLRVTAAGHRIVLGRRRVTHPVGPAPWHVSIAKQAGNGDDALMARLHGAGWRARAGAPAGRLRWHLATTAAAVTALGAWALRRRALAAALATTWAAATGHLFVRRAAPGPRSVTELAAMAATSVAIPPVATLSWARGWWRARRVVRGPHEVVDPGPVGPRREPGDRSAPEAVLLDRDGTLVVDVPYNGDPRAVEPVPGARQALDRLRRAGVALAVVSNQSGIGRGLLTREQVDAVNRRVEELLGPMDGWFVCPHAPEERCDCRKPQPGLVHKAAAELGVDPERCAVIGDIGADVEAARAAGCRGILVPTHVTLPEEVGAAREVAPTLGAAVDLLLGTDRRARERVGA